MFYQDGGERHSRAAKMCARDRPCYTADPADRGPEPPMAVDRAATFRTFIARNPADPFPRYGLAIELKSRGDLAGSAAAFEELMAGFPDYVPSYLMAAGVLAGLGRKDDGVAVLRRGIEVATARGDGHARKELEAALAEALA